MIVQFKNNATEKSKKTVEKKLEENGYKSTWVSTQQGEYLIGVGSKTIDIRNIGHLEDIKDIHVVSETYKLVSKKWKVANTQIDFGDEVKIGQGAFGVMMGPCSIENEENIVQTLQFLKKQGVKMMRGGVYKPRSSPYSFRGLGLEGLKMWYTLAKKEGIKIVTEVMQVSQIEAMYDYVDLFQVGARNTQNFNLLDALGKVDKPVMIKRGISGTLDELLQSAEYVFSNGNEKVLLCERGIRTYETSSRNTFDINAIPILKEKSHLPVIADASHGVGLREHVASVLYAATVAGADGIIVEIHPCPNKAYSDGRQTLGFDQSATLIKKIKELLKWRG